MTDEITLLPCPFCGGEAFASADEWEDWAFRCGCRTIGCKGWGERPETKPAAIAAWNRRASQAAPASDGLREALETIRDGYGPNHLSKFALAIASAALSSPTQGGAA